eukprot:4986447-Amphidinium_carterae.1
MSIILTCSMEENYRTWCALTGSAPSKTPIKDVVVEVLNRLNLAEQRAIKIDIDTFFRLLLEFNKVVWAHMVLLGYTLLCSSLKL